MRLGSQRHAPVSLTPGPLWTRAENLVPTRIRSPERPARSESLYQQIILKGNVRCRAEGRYQGSTPVFLNFFFFLVGPLWAQYNCVALTLAQAVAYQAHLIW